MASYHFENHCTAPETVQTLRQDHFVKSRADISKLAQMAKDILWVQNLGTDIPSREDFRDGLGGWFLGWISGIFLDQSFGKVWPNLGFVLIRYEYFTTCQWIVFWLDLGFVLTRYKYFRAYLWTFFWPDLGETSTGLPDLVQCGNFTWIHLMHIHCSR